VDSKDHRIFIKLADCCLKKGDRNQAVEVLEEFQRLGIRNAQISEMLEGL
jgi:pentatricopeptide repeat protein